MNIIVLTPPNLKLNLWIEKTDNLMLKTGLTTRQIIIEGKLHIVYKLRGIISTLWVNGLKIINFH